jgi:competence protein ComEA
VRKISSLLYFLSIAALALMITLTLNPAATYAQAKKDLVDLNKASEKELEALKGVGPATAKKIIENRPYKSADELSKAGVPAKTIQDLKPFVTVGPAAPAPKPAKKVEKAAAKPAEVTEKAAKTEKTKPAKEKAASAEKAKAPAAEKAKAAEKAAPKLAPGQKVNINTATKEQLEALPEIGPAKAQAIIEGRPFQKPEDIMKVKGIKEGTFGKIKDYITVK